MSAVAPTTPRPKSQYFLAASLLALFLTIVGFLKTFFIPLASGAFTAPAVIWVHGALLACWTVLLVVQSFLVRSRRVRLHRRLGYAGLALVPGVVLSTMAAGVYVLRRDVAAGGGQLAVSNLVGTFTTPLLFAAIVTGAFLYRRQPEVHRRLMLLAMIAIMWPAFFRFRHYFPPVDNPDFWFGYVLPNSMVVIVMLWEKITAGSVHPVYIWAGLFVVAENGLEVYLFNSNGWRLLANWMAGFFL